MGASCGYGFSKEAESKRPAYREHMDSALKNKDVLLEHYQPPEFPMIPVITNDTHRVLTESTIQMQPMEK